RSKRVDVKSPRGSEHALTTLRIDDGACRHENAGHSREQHEESSALLLRTATWHKGKQTIAVGKQGLIDPLPNLERLTRQLRSQGGNCATSSRIAQVLDAQVVHDHGPERLSFRGRLRYGHHSVAHLVERSSHRCRVQIALALEMPVETALG